MGFSWSYYALRRLFQARGIEPHEAMNALKGSWPRPEHHRETGARSLAFWGRTPAGRYLKVYTHRVGRWDWEIYDAVDMTEAEATEYDQWKDQRND